MHKFHEQVNNMQGIPFGGSTTVLKVKTQKVTMSDQGTMLIQQINAQGHYDRSTHKVKLRDQCTGLINVIS